MATAVALPLGASLLLFLFGARLGRWLQPATAVRLLSVTALVTAVATGFSLGVAAFVALAQVPDVAGMGHWSVATLRAGDPIPTAAGALAGAAVLLLVAASIRRVVRGGYDLATAVITCRRLGPSAAGLVVVDTDEAEAYALPGLGGRVVVSTTMLQALPAAERRALLAHEMAHLEHHHHLYVQLAELAAAANPLLRPLAATVRKGIERWADEAAAIEVGDRQLVARALARAALARAATVTLRTAPAAAFTAVDNSVVDRALALLELPPKSRRGLIAVISALLVITTASGALTAHQTEQRFERAQAAYRMAR